MSSNINRDIIREGLKNASHNPTRIISDERWDEIHAEGAKVKAAHEARIASGQPETAEEAMMAGWSIAQIREAGLR